MTEQVDAQPENFESALHELEQIVTTMESGQLSLAQSLSSYQRGAELLAFCQRALDAARQQIDVLENGVLKPYLSPGNQRDV